MLVSSICHPLQMLHMELFGPTSVRSINHKTYCLVATDDYSRCDNGNEIKNNDMNQLCGMKGIKREFSVARTPQQNEVAERKNKTLIEAVRTMLSDSLLPTTFWAEAVNTGCYVQSRVLVTKPHNKTSYELLLGKPPSISFMRPFGCLVTILNTLDPLGKFDRKADEGFLVGYSINSNAFRVFNTRTRKVKENLHKNFLENKPNVVGSGPEWLFDIDSLTKSINYEPVTAGNQTNKNAGIKDNADAVPTQQYILLPLLYDGPQSSKDVVANDVGKKIDEEPAHEAELDNLLVQQKEGYANSTNRDSTICLSISTAEQNFTNTDDLPTDPLIPDLEYTGIFGGAYDDEDVGAEVDLNNLETTMNVSPIPTTRIHKDHPKDKIIRDINLATQTRRMIKIIEEHAMWVYRNKKDERGIIVRNKERLVTQGTIEEEVYVCQPPGFEDLQFPNKVYKVEKALYGLHQASRAWYETLSTYLLENGYRRGTIDKTLFIKKDRGDILYMGELTFFLGLQVMQKDDGIFISQDKYVADILKKFDFVTVKAASTPIETNKALNKGEEAKDMDVHLYRSMIRSWMYLTASRPDIMFVVCACARDSPFDLKAFSDSDYAGASLDRKSTTGAEYVAAANCCGQIDSYEKKLIQVIKIHTDHNIADLLINAFDVSSTAEPKLVPFVTVGDNTAEGVNSKYNGFFACSHTIYASYIEQFWATAKSKTVNNVKQIHATVDGKTMVILESSVMIDLYFNDEDGITCLSNDEIFVNLALMGQAKRGQDNEIPQSSGSPKKVSDEAVYIEEDDRVVRAATTASSLKAEQESGNIHKTRPTATLNESSPQGLGSGSGLRRQDTTLGGADAQTRFETASKKSYNPPLSEGNTSRSGEDSMEHPVDLTDFVPPTPHDSPLSGGHTPRSDEDKENVSKHGRKSNKTKPMFNDSDFDVLDDAMENVEGGSTAEQITTAGDILNTASINVSCDIRQF
ncbi:putative ribonuclease H-like domain-containing protein [Tanacetum coccineum]|uniref:Ribonuclease H-like domain-containing protein n=1 Tax=Tanacetum coccineum TaxID=301880 RepID=A0ABQ5I7Y8_9ASTR